MWHLKLKGGLELSENQVGVWDRVPANVEIEAVAFVVARQSNIPPFVMDFRGYDAYCCARVANASIGAHSVVGYAVSLRKRDQVHEVILTPDGMHFRTMSIDKHDLPEHCWRYATKE
jgi:hypothetical protein